MKIEVMKLNVMAAVAAVGYHTPPQTEAVATPQQHLFSQS